MKNKAKSWLWKLTWPFAHANFTTVWDTLYYPKGVPPWPSIVRHEEIHSRQQHGWTVFGLPLWLALYILALPVLFNPFRWHWEYEAYRSGSGYDHKNASKVLTSRAYGWLFFNYWLTGWAYKRFFKVQGDQK